MSKDKVVEDVVEEVVEIVETKEWKTAARKLKKLVEDQSMDTYFKKHIIEQLRDRYNSKERTQELYDSIMGL